MGWDAFLHPNEIGRRAAISQLPCYITKVGRRARGRCLTPSLRRL